MELVEYLQLNPALEQAMSAVGELFFENVIALSILMLPVLVVSVAMDSIKLKNKEHMNSAQSGRLTANNTENHGKEVMKF